MPSFRCGALSTGLSMPFRSIQAASIHLERSGSILIIVHAYNGIMYHVIVNYKLLYYSINNIFNCCQPQLPGHVSIIILLN